MLGYGLYWKQQHAARADASVNTRARRSLSPPLDVPAAGHDYPRALRDYALIGGRVPMLPRWELGPQYSRWFAYHGEQM
jgi:alpha-glucosidase (family GH31 glycosyl hydrolase)